MQIIYLIDNNVIIEKELKKKLCFFLIITFSNIGVVPRIKKIRDLSANVRNINIYLSPFEIF